MESAMGFVRSLERNLKGKELEIDQELSKAISDRL